MSRMTSTPRLAGDPRDLGDEILRPVVDRVIGAERPAERGLVVAARRREHRRAELLGELDRREADAARAAVDQHFLAALQAAAIDEVVPDGEVIFGQARGFEQREARRDRQAERPRVSCSTRRSRRPASARRRRRRFAMTSTPAPQATIVPATSSPMIGDASGGGGYVPARCAQSGRLTPAWLTSISTSPSFGCGNGSFGDREHVGRTGLARGDVAHGGREGTCSIDMVGLRG